MTYYIYGNGIGMYCDVC